MSWKQSSRTVSTRPGVRVSLTPAIPGRCSLTSVLPESLLHVDVIQQAYLLNDLLVYGYYVCRLDVRGFVLLEDEQVVANHQDLFEDGLFSAARGSPNSGRVGHGNGLYAFTRFSLTVLFWSLSV